MAKAKQTIEPNADRINIVSSRSFAKKVRAIADHRDITMAEVLERFASPAIEREYRKCLDEMTREIGGEG